MKRLGPEVCLTLYRESLEIQDKGLISPNRRLPNLIGGVLVSDKSRKKSAGAVFFGLIQQKVRDGEIPKEDWTYIRAVN